ncbi:MAG: DUF2080 family transposase-associated protein [Candidatus Methanofastidiosia archaeon]
MYSARLPSRHPRPDRWRAWRGASSPFGNSGKADVPKRFIGRMAYVLILKEDGE